MKNTVKYLAILVVALTVSSALFAAQGGNSANCSTTPATEGTTWGSSHSVSSDAVNTNSVCKASTASNPKVEGGNDQQHGLAYAFGKLVNALGAYIEGATWGGNGGLPGR